jgi:polyisoprenoid-binding protein YceI
MLGLLLFVLGAASASETATYKVVAGESRMSVHVGTAGLFKMFGHEHNIAVKGLTGTVDWDPDAPAGSRFVLEIDASTFVVSDEELSEEDRAQVQSDMESKALASKENPKIVFQSTEVQAEKAQGAARRLKIKGTLQLRGATKPVEVPVTLEVGEGRLTAKGEMELDANNWGVPQISAVGGSVKTKDELKLTYVIVAVR